MSNREKKLNKSDVRIGIWKFILSFVVLSGVSFCAVFFFFKSYELQRKGVEKEAIEYDNLMQRSAVLKIQLDEIFAKMTSLDLKNVENDIFLTTQIKKNIVDAKSIMREDSTTNLRHYNALLKKIPTMLTLKSKILEADSKKQIAIRDLNQCLQQTGRANVELSKDPSRKFAAGRR